MACFTLRKYYLTGIFLPSCHISFTEGFSDINQVELLIRRRHLLTQEV